MTTQQIVTKLNALKKQQGLTLTQLSQKSGLAQGTINKIMSGALQRIKPDKLQALATALGVTVQSLTTDIHTAKRKGGFGLVTVACISPEVRVADVNYNVQQIAEQARIAYANGVKLAVFPELCITGYSCDDLFFQHTLRRAATDGLQQLAAMLADIDMLTVVGLPMSSSNGAMYNVAAVLFHGEVLAFVPKTNLPNYNEFYEKRVFTPAQNFVDYVEFNGRQVPFGTDIIFADKLCPEFRFAVEVCEDIWVSDSPSVRHAYAGANLVLNLSASNETVVKQDYRRKMVELQSGMTGTVYVYCSSGPSESTTSTVFSGHNIICENSQIVAESQPFTTGYAQAQVDLGFIGNERSRMCHVQQGGYLTVEFSLSDDAEPTRVYDPSPFVPTDKEQSDIRCERALAILSNGLARRIKHVNAQTLVIGVSGGTDSSLALLTAVRALKILGRPASDIISVTMPCFGTTERTLNNSIALATVLGTTVRKIDITKSVTQHLADIGHDIAVTDTTYENAQARERTQVLMDIANKTNGLVLGTGDMSELALGWATFNGDQMSMYGVNAGVPKTLVRALLRYEAARLGGETRRVLLDVIDTPVSPELLPPDQSGAIRQVTEDLVGPYELHDYFLFMMIRKGFAPSKIYALARLSFAGVYTDEEIYKWLRKFVWRFFTQQFKRSCSPDSVRLGSVDLSKYGHRMPSDACCDTWLADLDEYVKE